MTAKLTAAWTPLRYHAGQAALWTCPKRFVAVCAGRGSGKTEIAKRRLVRALGETKPWRDPRYFYGGPTHDQAKRVAWQDLLDLTPKHWIRTISLSELRITTIFGSELWVIGLDKPQRIEGVQWDGCVLDESSDLRPGVFTLNILPALSHRTGWCWRIGVPKRTGPGAPEFRAFFLKGMAGEDPNTAAFWWPSSDILSADALSYARANLDAKDYREQFDARWETAGGRIFHAFERDYNVRPCAYHPEKMVIVGSDFNVDPMAWVLGHVYDRQRVEWFDEVWIRDTNTQATLNVLAGRYSGHRGGWEFYGDATGRARKTSASLSDYQQILEHPEFKRMGRTVHYPRSNPVVADRFAACNAMFANAAGDRRMFVDPRCKRLIADLENRHYRPGTREVEDSGDLGHACLVGDTMVETSRGPFPIREVREGDMVLTRYGYREVTWAGRSKPSAAIFRVLCSDGTFAEGTSNHRFWVEGAGFVPMGLLQSGISLHRMPENPSCALKRSCTRASSIGAIPIPSRRLSDGTLLAGQAMLSGDCTAKYGSTTLDQSPPAITFTTRIGTRPTTRWKIWSACHCPSIAAVTPLLQRLPQSAVRYLPQSVIWPPSGIAPVLAGRGTGNMPQSLLSDCGSERSLSSAASVENRTAYCSTSQPTLSAQRIAKQQRAASLVSMTNCGLAPRATRSSQSIAIEKSDFAPVRVLRVIDTHRSEPVYDLTVDGAHEFYANGLLVHNSDALGYPVSRLFPVRIALEPVSCGGISTTDGGRA